MFPLNLVGFFTSKAGLALIAVALVAAVIGTQTLRLNHAKHDLDTLRAADKAASDHARVIEANAAKISDTARNTLDQRQAQIITRYKTLVQKVPQYVDAKDDRNCTVPGGFVRLWNAPFDGPDLPGLTGPQPAPAGPLDPPRGR